MAIIHNTHMAGQKVSTRWGELQFDKKGNCEVEDGVARAFEKAKVHGYKIHGLAPDAEEDGDVDDEDLDEDLELEGSDDSDEGDGDDSKPKAPKMPKPKKKSSKKK